jgi:hypothetical protein
MGSTKWNMVLRTINSLSYPATPVLHTPLRGQASSNLRDCATVYSITENRPRFALRRRARHDNQERQKGLDFFGRGLSERTAGSQAFSKG